MQDYAYSNYNEFLGKREIINDKSIELLFGCTENFENAFHIIHRNFNDENFMDVESISLADFLNNFLVKNSILINELCNDTCILSNFIKQAKKECHVSLRKISELLGIPESKIGYYYRK